MVVRERVPFLVSNGRNHSGTSITMLKAIQLTDEGLDTDQAPTGAFVKVKMRSICEVPPHPFSVLLHSTNHLLLGMTGMIAKLSWDGYIIRYFALNDVS